MDRLESFSTKHSILDNFNLEDRKIIKQRLSLLTPLCRMVASDVNMKVEVNEGQGWHWDFKNNIVRCDAKDLLEKPIDYLRFVIQHEAGHRKISRVIGIIPDEIWNQPGFSSMMNAIEDPRMNNYVADNVPKFKQEMIFSYDVDAEFERKMKEKAKEKVGRVPRFMQAGLEYIKHWIAETKGEKIEIDKELPKEVIEVVEKTLSSARRSWLTYPLRREVEKGMVLNGEKLDGEQVVQEYARESYKINLEEVWPVFKTLVDSDTKDAEDKIRQDENQKSENKNQEVNKDQNSGEGEKDNQNSQSKEGEPKDENKNDSNKNEEKQKSSDKKEKGTDKQNENQVQDGNSTSGDREDKNDKSNSSKMSDQEIKEKAEQIIREIEKEMNEYLESKAELQKEKEIDSDSEEKSKANESQREEKDYSKDSEKEKRDKMKQALKEAIEKAKKDFDKEKYNGQTSYQKVLEDVSPIIFRLEDELRDIFIERKRNAWNSGYRSGMMIDVKREIRGEATGVDNLNVFTKKELPLEKDYAIQILVDLSGSMSGTKISETYKAVVVLCEALRNIGIKLSVTGFNDRLYEYKEFDEDYTDDLREGTEDMLSEVNNHDGGRADYNDDGWAVDEMFKKIKKREEKKKILFVLSDGVPEESPRHEGYDLKEIVKKIEADEEVHIIGLGIGSGTEHVKTFYSDNIANVNIKEFSEKLAEKVRQVVEG